jgi:tetratricopeptide (TPR) repeat protein
MRRRTFFTCLLAALAFALWSTAALAQDLPNEQSRRDALEFYRSGQEFMSAEQFEKAADAFTKATASNPIFTLAYYQLGQAYMNLHRYASAIQAFQECIEAARKVYGIGESGRFNLERQRDDEIHAQREYVQELQQAGRTAVAAAEEGRLHDLENHRTSMRSGFRPPAEALLSLGSAYFRNGDREQAEAEWKAATEVNPKFGEAWNNLAAIYLQDGRKADAQAAVKAAEKSGYRVNPQMKKDIDGMK